MNKIKLITSVALATLGALSAHAGITVSAFDLILGFTQSGGSNLEVNLGSAANLVTLSGGAEVSLVGATTGLKLADLQTFGAGTAWQNGSTAWGVIGASNAGTDGNLIWGTVKGGATVGTPGAAQGTTNNAIKSMYGTANGALGGSGAVVSANSTNSAFVASSLANSWRARATSSLNFGYSPWSNKLTQTTAGLATSTFQSAALYAFTEGATSADFVGTFKLYNDGGFTFTAIPEPSTYAAILGVATLGFAAIRRRKQQIQAQA